MSKRVTLFSEEQSTIVATWTTEIICKSARGGACTLQTEVSDPDLSDEQDDYFDFCSEPITTKQEFLDAWQHCCDLMSVEAEIDDEVISKVETVCPLVAHQLQSE